MPLEKGRIYQNVVMKLSVLRFMVKTLSKQNCTSSEQVGQLVPLTSPFSQVIYHCNLHISC